MLNQTQSTCEICHARLNEDGTTDDCSGECDRDLSNDLDATKPLNFNNTDSVEFWDELPEFTDGETYHDYEDQS